MKPCQLCGVCSWGQVPGFINVDARSPQTFLVGQDLSAFRKCDNCGSYAALAYLEETFAVPVAPAANALDGPLDAVRKMFATAMPKPDTRTERILRALLSQAGMLKPPAEVVRYARELESRLDAPADSADWLVVRFADQRALQTWLAEGLKMTTCPESHEVIYASQFAQWAADHLP